MGSFGWFMIGVLTTQAVYLVMTTTPERAAQNLADWRRLLAAINRKLPIKEAASVLGRSEQGIRQKLRRMRLPRNSVAI